MQLRTPLLAKTQPKFKDYLASLTKSARHNYRAAMRENEGRRYVRIPYHEHTIEHFMGLWERQEVDGKHPRWVFGPEYFKNQDAIGSLRLFVVLEHESLIGMHPTEKHGRYIYSHPPCYDKARHPELARFMWFELMQWACENGVDYVDLGGGSNGTWRDCAKARVNGPFAYKWRYVPKTAKENPEDELPFVQMRCECGSKQITVSPLPCRRCG